MPRTGLRIAVVGATGALGSEVLACLDASRLPIAELVPVATERSLGHEIEFQGRSLPVETRFEAARGLDLIFLCAPRGASLEVARDALRAAVSVIDLSGALAGHAEVPLQVAAFGGLAPGEPRPLVASPPPGSLAWALVLRPLAEHAGLCRASGTVLEGASLGGKGGIEALYTESVAIFNQEDLPEASAFPRPVAFDCLPAVGELGEGGASEAERALLGGLERLFPGPRFAATVVQVPTFVGHGSALAVQTERPLDPKRARDLLARAPGVAVVDGDAPPTTRAAAGLDVVLVGRLRADPSCEAGLLLWLAADVLRLTAANGVGVAEARFAAH